MSSRTSVIIPVRNGVRFVAEAVHSVLAQLGPDDEIIVVDDASADDTRPAITRIQDSRIHLLDGPGRGVSSARNVGFSAATGEFISFLDHDDLWPPQRHVALLQALLADIKIDCVVGRLRLRIEQDAIMLPHISELEGKVRPNLVVGTALFRRRIIEKVGGFDEEIRFWEDTDFYVRLVEQNYRLVLCDADTLIYRRHSANATCDVEASRQGMLQMMHRRLIRMSGRGSDR